MAAAQYVDVPGYSAILLREHFPDLEQADALIPRSKEWWAGRAHYSEQRKRWTFPSGATISFGYLDRDDAVYQYQSAAFQFVGVDELTQHTKFRWTYMGSRVRKPSAGPLAAVPLRMRGATNPGNKGHDFVKDRFIPAEALRYEAGDDRFYARPWYLEDRFFVPARRQDNPSLDLAAYERGLAILDSLTRAQLDKGDWKAHAAGRWRREWFKRYRDIGDAYFLMDTGEIIHKLGLPCVATVDPANRQTKASKYTAMGAFADAGAQRVLALDVVREQLRLEQIVPQLDLLCRRWRPMWAGLEANGFQLFLANDARDRGRYPHIPTVYELDPEGRSKLTRATPAILRAEQGLFYVPQDGAAPWVEPYLSELCQFTGDDKVDSYTDQVDMTAYGILGLDQFGAGDDEPDIVSERRR